MAEKKKTLTTRKSDQPATTGLVWEVREELRASTRSLEHKMDAGFKGVDARLAKQDSKIDQVLVSVHRMQAIVEEQRSENRIKMETLVGLVKRTDRVEIRQDEYDKTLLSLARQAKTW